jgi:hypothetical protein
MKSLKHLVGLIVEGISKSHDYLQLFLDDGTVITIYNNYTFNKTSKEIFEKNKIISINETKDKIEFTIENTGDIIVSLKDDDYNGPEAIELSKKNQPTIVWS